MSEAKTNLQICSTLKKDAQIEISLEKAPLPTPGADEVLIRVEGAPINPADVGVMFTVGDPKNARPSGTPDRSAVSLAVPEMIVNYLSDRVDNALPMGMEGAGVVVEAGASAEARALVGRTVATFAGEMYTQYRAVKVSDCIVLPEGTTPAEAASCFVNPLTALGMVETIRREGHKALVHTAAASNLGQMLQKICLADGIPLVNVVRRKEQQELLRGIGAQHVVNSTEPSFVPDLIGALAETGATVCFDAVGGGPLADQILMCMEQAARQSHPTQGLYGTSVHKQVYIYGALEFSPTVLNRRYGMAWGIGAWLLFPFLDRIGKAGEQKLRDRIAAEIKTTFASSYAKEISLTEALDPENMVAYANKSTSGKYLINPSRE